MLEYNSEDGLFSHKYKLYRFKREPYHEIWLIELKKKYGIYVNCGQQQAWDRTYSIFPS